jgi:hypothetical protein
MVGAVDLSFIHDLTVFSRPAEPRTKDWTCEVLSVGDEPMRVPALSFDQHVLKWDLDALTGSRFEAVRTQFQTNGTITIRITWDTEQTEDLTIGLSGVSPSAALVLTAQSPA